MDVKSGYVTILGRPNAGKSTLMNALLGQKISITTNKPQTTRKRVLGILSDENSQIIFLDTPGILDPGYLLQKKMIEFVQMSIDDADLLVFMLDIKEDPNGIDLLGNPLVKQILDKVHKKKILLVNKIDLSSENKVLDLINKINKENKFEVVIPVSAMVGYNIDSVKNAITEFLPKGPKFYPEDQVSDETERFFVAEIIREKIFERYKEEIPYSTEVQIDTFTEREDKKDYIAASIIVEKESQKPIMIGKGGEAIKHLGKDARKDIESFLERGVFLELRVKVRPKWRSNENLLQKFGYITGNEK